MTKIWAIVAESSRARIYELEGPSSSIKELEDLVHPESRLHEQNLTSDLPGRGMDDMGSGHHAMSDKTDPKDQEAINFAKSISHLLESARVENKFDKLVVISEPSFLGLLRKHLTNATSQTVAQEIGKNLVRHKPEEIRKHIDRSVLI